MLSAELQLDHSPAKVLAAQPENLNSILGLTWWREENQHTCKIIKSEPDQSAVLCG